MDAVRASPSDANDEDPALLALQGGDLLLVWYSEAAGKADLWQARSSDGGRTWSSAVRTFDSAERDYYPTLAQTADGSVHLAWQRIDGSAYPNVFYARSLDDGFSWSSPSALTDDLERLDWAPALAARGDELALVFSSERSGQRDLHVQASTDQGESWLTPVRVTSDERFDDFASILLREDGTVALAWSRFASDDTSPADPTPSARLWLMEAGELAELPQAVARPFSDTAEAMDTYPWLYEVDGGLHVSWTSTRTGDAYGDIVGAPVEDDADLVQRTEGPYPDYTARLALTDDALVMAWVADPDRSGVRDIYVKRLAR